jgi:hypothetical protein
MNERRRTLTIALIAVLSGLALWWLVATALHHALPVASAKVSAYTVRSDTRMAITMTVDRPDPSVAVTCRLVAQAQDYQIVGERAVKVPSSTVRLLNVNIELVTLRRATSAPGPPAIAGSATVGGRIRRSSRFEVNAGQFAAIGRFLWWIATTVSSFLLGLVLVLFAPRAADATASTAARRLGASIGFGFLMLIGVPIAAVIAMALLVGIPIGLGVLLALGLLYWLGYTVGAFALGRRLVAAPRHRMLAFLAGFGILRVLALIPFVGGLVWLGATVWGSAPSCAARAAGRDPASQPATAPVGGHRSHLPDPHG